MWASLLKSLSLSLPPTLLPEQMIFLLPNKGMLSLFTEKSDNSQIFSVPFDSTPAVFDSKIPFICYNEWLY